MKKTIQLLSGAAGIMIVVTGIAAAQQLTVDISKVSDAGVGEKIGTVTIAENKQGTSFKVAVRGVPAGKHGFHVHEKGDCGPGEKNGKTEDLYNQLVELAKAQNKAGAGGTNIPATFMRVTVQL